MHRCSGLQSSTSPSFSHASPVVTYIGEERRHLGINPLAPASAAIEINTCHVSLLRWGLRHCEAEKSIPLDLSEFLTFWIPIQCFTSLRSIRGLSHICRDTFFFSRVWRRWTSDSTYLKICLTSLLIGSIILGYKVISLRTLKLLLHYCIQVLPGKHDVIWFSFLWVGNVFSLLKLLGFLSFRDFI